MSSSARHPAASPQQVRNRHTAPEPASVRGGDTPRPGVAFPAPCRSPASACGSAAAACAFCPHGACSFLPPAQLCSSSAGRRSCRASCGYSYPVRPAHSPRSRCRCAAAMQAVRPSDAAAQAEHTDSAAALAASPAADTAASPAAQAVQARGTRAAAAGRRATAFHVRGAWPALPRCGGAALHSCGGCTRPASAVLYERAAARRPE